MTDESVLEVADLRVDIGRRTIVEDVSFRVDRGQTLGIVGESGSGKSITVLAATGLLDAPASRASGSAVLAGSTQLVGASPKMLRRVHGNKIGFVFQDPSTSLNPLLTLERQITEPLKVHRGLTRREARKRALELLDAVGIPQPDTRLSSYPHQLSGGQRQRVMIAIALACDPALLIADEPTTALDVTTQAQIVELIQTLQRDRGAAVVWISHDLGVIGQVADDIAVLRHGRIVEHEAALEIFDRPKHEYTRELLAARPTLATAQAPPAILGDTPVLLEVSGLNVTFSVSTPTGRNTVRAVRNVSFEARRGQTLGIVGESGSGKSTIANALTGLVEADSGSARLNGADLLKVKRSDRKALRSKVAMVFQDPYSSINPRSSIEAAITEPLMVHGLVRGAAERARRVRELLALVDLPADFASRFPHELSGGQRQRVSIARALALEPDVMILDESTSALDVSIQARVLELLTRLQRELGLTYLLIAHDLAIVQKMSHDVLVLFNGEAVEQRPTAELFADPHQEYTRELLAAIPPVRPKAARVNPD